MKTNKNPTYIILGGQHRWTFHGTAATLQTAKRIASRNGQLYDNGQGLHRPEIYFISDCTDDVNINGNLIIRPKYGAAPVAVWDRISKRWRNGSFACA